VWVNLAGQGGGPPNGGGGEPGKQGTDPNFRITTKKIKAWGTPPPPQTVLPSLQTKTIFVIHCKTFKRREKNKGKKQKKGRKGKKKKKKGKKKKKKKKTRKKNKNKQKKKKEGEKPGGKNKKSPAASVYAQVFTG